MQLVDKSISKTALKELSKRFSAGLVKAVVDTKREIMVVDASMHADEEKELLDTGSRQDDLWGINLYPDVSGEDFLEFDSMINVRPRLNNYTRGVEDEHLRKKITDIVLKLVSD